MTISGAEARATARLTPALKRRVVREAIDFLVQREALSAAQRAQLEAVPIRWRRRRGPSRFYLGAAHGFTGPHILVSVGRGAHVRWHTYRRVRAGLATPREGIVVPLALYTTLALVHEFTHALQHGVCGTPKRRYSEVETTDNEIEFVRRVAPRLHAQLVPVARKGRSHARGRLDAEQRQALGKRALHERGKAQAGKARGRVGRLEHGAGLVEAGVGIGQLMQRGAEALWRLVFGGGQHHARETE